MSNSKGLGRGLGALFQPIDVEDGDETVHEAEISELRANPYQPRKEFDPDSCRNWQSPLSNTGLSNR